MSLSIQERLKDLRVERGLTLEQLASKNPGWRKVMCRNGEKENNKYALGGDGAFNR